MKKITDIIDRYVFELWLGIILFGVVCEVGVFFVKDKATYSICLAVGILAAIISAYHMWWSIDRSLAAGEAEAAKKMSVQYIIRYIFYILVLGSMGVLFGNYVLVTFLGLMSIKASSYMEPLLKKFSVMIYGEEILPPVIEYLYDEEKPVDTQE